MSPAWTALVGVLLGAVATGTVQYLLARRSSSERRWERLRDERRDVYIRALWAAKSLPEFFATGVSRESDGDEPGDLGPTIDELRRAILELRILGDASVAQAVTAYADEFTDWVNGLDPDAPIQGFDALRAHLESQEGEIIMAMRSELGSDAR